MKYGKELNFPDFIQKKLLKQQNSKTLSIEISALIQTHINGRMCPHCHSHEVISTGNYKNRKRYLCKKCGKYFNDLTKTPFSGIHSHKKVEKYLQCMIDGFSIRKSAQVVGISVTTSFNWRHKLLDKIKELPAPSRKELIEVKEIKVPYSAKGQRSPISKNLSESKVSLIFTSDRTGKIDSDSTLWRERSKNKVLDRLKFDLFENKNIVIPASSSVLEKILKKKTNQITNSHSCGEVEKSIIEWKEWMFRFRGVATKYMMNYLHWFDYLKNSIHKVKRCDSFLHLLLHHGIKVGK
jgi:transposase-like protein